jgi:hypothetical protein
MEQLRTEPWVRPDFEVLGCGMEVSAYTNDWDQT